MRVLFVVNTLPPHDLSGAGEQAIQLANGLRERGHEVQFLGRGPGGARGPKILFPWTVLWPLKQRVRSWRPDVVQVHESDGGPAVRWLTRQTAGERPFVVALQQVSYVEERRVVAPVVDRASGRTVARPTLGELAFRWLRTPFHILLGRWTSRGADLVLAPSRRTARELERDYGAVDVQVLPNATREVVPERAAPALSVDSSSRPGYFLYVGRLRLRKGVEILLEAMRATPDAVLQVAGDGERSRLLRRRARELELDAGRVHFLGRVGAAEVRRLLGGSRALVVPSLYEGMPLVVLEAMAAGRPVIATSVSGIPEVVEHGETGWVVEACRSDVLAKALAAAWSDAAEADRRGARGLHRLREHFSPSRVSALWEELVTTHLRDATER